MRHCPGKMEEKLSSLIKEDGTFSLGRHCVDQACETQSRNFAQDEQGRRHTMSRADNRVQGQQSCQTTRPIVITHNPGNYPRVRQQNNLAAVRGLCFCLV